MPVPDSRHARRPATYPTGRPATYRTITITIADAAASGPSIHSSTAADTAQPRTVVPPNPAESGHARRNTIPDSSSTSRGEEPGDDPFAGRRTTPASRRMSQVRVVDSDCLVGISDPHRPGVVHARTVGYGGHPHDMLPTLRRIWIDAGGDSTRLARDLLAHDWLHLDPTAGRPPQGDTDTNRCCDSPITDRRVISGIGIAYAATGAAATDAEPVTVVPLSHLRLIDATWLYLLDPATDTIAVHTGDGEPVSRHVLHR